MRPTRFILVLFMITSMTLGGFLTYPLLPNTSSSQSGSKIVDLGDGTTIEVGPDETLYKYIISTAPSQASGSGSPLTVSEYGTRTDTFTGSTMSYSSSTHTTTTANLSVPLGDQWQGYKVFGNLTDITENRTWIVNSGFGTNTNWNYKTGQLEGYFSGNDRIQVFSSGGTYQRQWGSRGTGTSNFIDPWGVAINSTGFIYVADTYNNRILVFSRTGVYQFQWGTYGTGFGQFDRPMGIAINSTGYVYVADYGNDRIQVFNRRGVYQTSWGSAGEGNSLFHGPVGVAVMNYNGRIYVVDSGNARVQYFSSTGSYAGQWASAGLPHGITILQSSQQVFVSETSNNRVRRFSETGGSATTIGSGLLTPEGVAASPISTYIYINDAGNHRVQRYDNSNGATTNWGSDGTGNGNFRFNYGIAVNSTGYVYTCESSGRDRARSSWLSTGHGTGNGSPGFIIDGYYHDAGGGLYGYWYNPGTKAFVKQDLVVPRGQITWLGISLDYYAACRGWSAMTGFFELFVSAGDPDAGGVYLWNKQFDKIAAENTWYSTGLLPVDASSITLPNVPIMAGLRVTQSEWYRPEIGPEGRIDNILIYMKAKATPQNINLNMDGVSVSNVMNGSNPIYGRGTATFTPTIPWQSGKAYANFSWTPTPNPPDPDMSITVAINAFVTVWARRYNVLTINDTAKFTTGDNYVVQNASSVRWETNNYVAVPGGYSSYYFYNVSIPLNRDIDFVAEPTHRTTNLTSGWSYGNPGNGRLNVSVYKITTVNQNGFWLLKGSSPNMIANLQVWNTATSQWTTTKTFRANEVTRFRASMSVSTYTGDIVYFSVYDSAGNLWKTLQATVDGSGYAISGYVTFGAANASVGSWEVQAYAVDSVSGAGQVRNAGFYRRAFSINHSTKMAVKYPTGSETSWTYNATFGELVLLQLRVNDSDRGDLLAGGVMTYSWAAGSGIVADLGTGEYSVTLNTGLLSSNGQFPVSLQWSKSYYDTVAKTFNINVLYTSELFSSDAPGVDVPRGYAATLHLYFTDQFSTGIQGASIVCNWTKDTYSVTPEVGSPGRYILSVQTGAASLGTYNIQITAIKDFYETRSIILSVQVRELHTSAIPSASLLSLPVGYITSLTITYTDTDHGTPITGAASAISCNWSDIHEKGDQNYTVSQTATPGVYQVTIYSADLDVLRSYTVVFRVERYGSQNHTFTVTVVLRTHLTSFDLLNAIDPTAYTGRVYIYVSYFDSDAMTGIQNGSAVGYYVKMRVTSPSLPGIKYQIVNGSQPGYYVIIIRADQWGSTGTKDLVIYANWTGPTVKYYNKVISSSVSITASPTDLYIGESPVMTPYGEDISFTVIYYDVSNTTGVVNGTGPFQGNVKIYVSVLTPGQSLTQSVTVITEIDFVNRPGEYRIVFSTNYLSGLIGCELKIWLNWTVGQLPYYESKALLITVYSTFRLTTADWTPLPVTPYDELVNLTLVYRDAITGDAILKTSKLTITVDEAIPYTVYYLGNATGVFKIRLNTSSWSPGTHTFHINILWAGKPYYQNQTHVSVLITVRYRYTDLTHGSYTPIQYANSLVLVFTYRDLDDYTTTGMNGGTLSLDSSLSGHYTIQDNGDGTYTLTFDTSAFPTLGVYMINATIRYNGARFCSNATDFFYLTIEERRTQLTSETPDLAPYLTQANVTVRYSDDTTGAGIAGASIYASCAASNQTLVKGVNYWVDYISDGNYRIRISTPALGNFGSYTVVVTANWTGSPFYMQRLRSVGIEVSRRPATLSVSRSPLNTPFLENVVFEVTAADGLLGTPITLTKSVLILTHGLGTIINPASYTLSGSNGVYTISFNSTLIGSYLVSDHAIGLQLFWGNMAPYYSNSTASTEVTITGRYTQASVLSTPPAYYYYNISAVIKYTDYLKGTGIAGAVLTWRCVNKSSVQGWVINRGDGSYEIRVNTTGLPSIGKYFFLANLTWTGLPYYQNITGVAFNVMVNPVSTVLSFELPVGDLHYLGDSVVGNITFKTIATGAGIGGASVTTNWTILYGTSATIVPLGNGVYRLTIVTTSLNAGLYSFAISASKYLYVNRTITADILLSSVPVSIALRATPTAPTWGDIVDIEVNITNFRTGSPITGADVNLTISSNVYVMSDIGGGIYRCTVPTAQYASGEYTMTVTFVLLNYETRSQGFQIRIAKIGATISGSIDPQITVNGHIVNIAAEYLIQSNSSPISVGSLTYGWVGGSGVLTWNASMYTVQFIVTGAAVGTHQILLVASSANYKTVSYQVTIEIREVATELEPYLGQTVFTVVSGDYVNVTVFLNNTDLDLPVTGATLSYSLGVYVGNLTDLGNGYYGGNVPTGTSEIREWLVTISSMKTGYSPSSIQLTVTIIQIPTTIVIVSSPLQYGYYGNNVTFLFTYWDSHNNKPIANATGQFTVESVGGTLIDLSNGSYSLEVDTTWMAAGLVEHDVFISLHTPRYDYAFTVVKLNVMPIKTVVIGTQEVSVPVGDDYRQLFQFNDTLNNHLIMDASATAVWEFGVNALTNLGNGSYRFSTLETNISRLEVRSEPYIIRIEFSRGNYSHGEFILNLTIRKIATQLIVVPPPSNVYAGGVVVIRLTYWDVDHDVPIANAINSTSGTDLYAVPAENIDYGNGTYVLGFLAPRAGILNLVVHFDKTDYSTGVYSVAIYALISPEQAMLVTAFAYGSIVLILIAGVGALYVKVLSVPKMLRRIRSMVNKLSKGRIPSPASVRDRREMLLDIMNDELAAVGLSKSVEDVGLSTVDITILDVDKLLTELAQVVGLSESDIGVLRQDLEKMRPSERAGFIGEVLKQERARRAREIIEAEKVAKPGKAIERLERKLTEDELMGLRQRLIEMGIEETEADVMIEQARNLTKAEIDALLDQIGGEKK